MRYKKIKFDTFSEGEIQKKYSDLPKMSFSQKIRLDENNRVILSSSLTPYKISDSYHYVNSSVYGICSACNGNDSDIYILVTKQIGGIEKVYLYMTYGNSTPTFIKDFGEGSLNSLFFFNDYLLVTFLNDSTGDYETYASSDPSDPSSYVKLTTLGYYEIISYAIHNNTLYITSWYSPSKYCVYRSTDGLTFSRIIYNSPINQICEYQGFLYGYNDRLGDFYILENNSFRLVTTNVKGDYLHVAGDKLRLFDHGDIYCFNGTRFFLEESYIRGGSYIPSTSRTKTYFYQIFNNISGNYDFLIFSLDSNGVLLCEYSFIDVSEDDFQPDHIIFNNNYTFFLWDDFNDFGVHVGVDKGLYTSLGFYETTLVNDGEIIPKQIILQHSPLITNTSVKVYGKTDLSSSWGSVLINSDTVGSIKKVYTFPKNKQCDFIQFKIELLTSNPSITPSDIQLSFVYQNVGLENSK